MTTHKVREKALSFADGIFASLSSQPVGLRWVNLNKPNLFILALAVSARDKSKNSSFIEFPFKNFVSILNVLGSTTPNFKFSLNFKFFENFTKIKIQTTQRIFLIHSFLCL